MAMVNIHEAKSTLSKLVEAVQSGAETEVIIARNGRPAARLVPIAKKQVIRFGLGKGKFNLPDDFDADNELIQAMFEDRLPE
jgi:prevent-host-death family protein